MTGLNIIDAILAGERDPEALARLRDRRIHASKETIAKSLVGDYRPEHLFTLRQSLAACRHYQKLIAETDREIEQWLKQLPTAIDPAEKPLTRERNPRKTPSGNEPTFNLREHLYRILVDLTQIPGFKVLTVQTLLSEIGPDLSRFPNVSAFTSWLTLCPDNRVSGGRILSTQTRKSKNRATMALRMAAQGLHRSQTWLGQFYRRMRARLGAPKAITATAHKLARIVYHLLTTREPYSESIFQEQQDRYRARKEARLRCEAQLLGFDLVPAVAATSEAGVP